MRTMVESKELRSSKSDETRFRVDWKEAAKDLRSVGRRCGESSDLSTCDECAKFDEF